MEQNQLNLFAGEHPASPSQLQDLEKDWTIRVATWHLSILELLRNYAQGGLYGKTSPEFCQATEDGILEPLSGRWGNSGMGGATESWTLNTSEFHNEGEGSLLSHILLETGDVPPRYFLSERACQGILRRAKKRGKKLPEELEMALTQQSMQCLDKNGDQTSG